MVHGHGHGNTDLLGSALKRGMSLSTIDTYFPELSKAARRRKSKSKKSKKKRKKR